MDPLKRSILMRYSKWIRETSEPTNTIKKKKKKRWDKLTSRKTWKLTNKMTIN